MKKIVVCSSCEAECTIRYDLEEPYMMGFCPFCGEELEEDNIDEIGDEDPIS